MLGFDPRVAAQAREQSDPGRVARVGLRRRGVARVDTVSVGAQWLVSSEVDEEMVYQITRSLWHRNSRKLLDNGHAKGKHISLATALEGISIPLHPGSKRFYNEIGITSE